MKRLLRLVFSTAATVTIISPSNAADSFPGAIHVDAAKTQGELKPIWRFFGADEPNYAYMTHGKKLLAELGELRPKQVYFRTHNLLTSGDGTPALKWGSTGAYTEDAGGNPVYDWTILDRIFDTYLERFHFISCQRRSPHDQQLRAHGHCQSATHDRRRLPNRGFIS